MPGTINDHITENLIDFYSEVAQLGGLPISGIAGIPYVGSQAGGWPGYLLGGQDLSAEKVAAIATAMEGGKVPPFWIMESAPGNKTEKLLSYRGIRMINYWIGMYQEAQQLEYIPPQELRFEIRKCSKESEMDAWVELVNRVVMTSSQLDKELFRKLLYFDKFHFYGLWEGDEILSTTLIFVQNQTAGLYFVATRQAHQGKGYGTAITDYAMNDVKAAGANRFVLHSTREGLPLYQKTGFREMNRYDIYWLLGKR
jgi:ribosomal protein S18 acetylase RimI-like enzyme